MSKLYIQHEGKVVAADNNFEHVMAVTLDPTTHYQKGVIRCIKSRVGSVTTTGSIDRSELHYITGTSLEHFIIGERIHIENEEQIIKEITPPHLDFLGLEDPDIFIDTETNVTHLYFTLPFIPKHKNGSYLICLGHAMGPNLDQLEMTTPVLIPSEKNNFQNAKEVSIAPKNSKGFRYNLIESSDRDGKTHYSTCRVVIAHDMGKPWEFGDVAFYPKETDIAWINKDASPGPLFSKNFIDVGENKLLGIMNGKNLNQTMPDGTIKYGEFTIGLFIYNYEKGKVEWVSQQPLIRDSESTGITFASQFVETGLGKGILYAHVDDSFVRAYTLEADKIQELLPK